jgi:oligopeptidase B
MNLARNMRTKGAGDAKMKRKAFGMVRMATILTTTVTTPDLPAVDATSPQPPVASKIPKADVVHGDRRVDNYFWLREKSNPEVKAYLEAENAYTDAIMKPTERLQGALYEEMVGHIKETDLSVPFLRDGYYYYSRTEQGKQYPTWCRKKGGLDAPEEIVLDLNELAKGEKFLGLGALVVSDDGHLLAYSTDTTGFRQYTLHVKDLRSGQILPDQVERTGSVAWAGDNRTLFYTVEDAAKRQYRLYRHHLGTAQDDLIYEEKDERFNVNVERSRSRAYFFLASGSHTTSEWRYLPAGEPAGEWKVIVPREQDREYAVDHHGDQFFIRINDTGRNFRLLTAPISDPRKKNWKEVVAHRPGVCLTGVEMFANFYVLLEREEGLPRIRVTDFGGGMSHAVVFPEAVYAAFPAENHEYNAKLFRYSYQSLVTPNSVYDYDVETRGSKLLKRVEVPGYDLAQYRSERLWATATDGTRIAISLVYRKDFERDGPPREGCLGSRASTMQLSGPQGGSRPCLLTGYGSYGFPYPITFNSSRLSLLDRGFVFAIAHIRGGGEMGKAWHDQGRMMNKKNTFTDFIAAAEYLLAEKYTSRDRLVITGGSAGGLLMGAVTNMRPDLFKAVVMLVPFVDVVNTMLDASLPLTVAEYEEWGNPQTKAEYEYIKTYCPYTNLGSGPYPSLLVKTSFNDSQVMYWEPAKYVAKLRALEIDSNPLLLKVNMAAGHSGASGRYDHLHETAFEYAFMFWQVGLQ